MTTLIRNLTLASLVLIATSLTGCIKFKQTTTVMPDGSGKFDISFGISDQMMQVAQQQGEDPFAEMDPKEMSENAKGIVAFTEPVKEKKGGYTYMSFSAYFEDINEVELSGPDDEGDPPKYTYKRDGGAATLTVENSMIFAIVSEHEPMAPEEKAFAAQMLAGMSFNEEYVLPGAFEDIKGVKSADNTASIELGANDMLDGTGPIKDLKDAEELVFKIGEVKEDDAALKAFKEELEAAKKEWEEMQAE